MAYNRTQARSLCSATEYELFMASLADAITDLSAAELRGKIRRSRTLRDKNADLFRRQTLATRAATGTRRGTSGAANQRTEQKAQLFDQALKRFEARLEKLEARAARQEAADRAAAAARAAQRTRTSRAGAAKKPPGKPPATARSPKAPAKQVAKGKPAALGAGPGRKGISPTVAVRGKAITAHLRSSTARRQGRRDGR